MKKNPGSIKIHFARNNGWKIVKSFRNNCRIVCFFQFMSDIRTCTRFPLNLNSWNGLYATTDAYRIVVEQFVNCFLGHASCLSNGTLKESQGNIFQHFQDEFSYSVHFLSILLNYSFTENRLCIFYWREI